MPATRPLMLGVGLALSITASRAGPVSAQPTDSQALAGQLFERGRELAKAHRWAEACPKFEASLRYDAVLGTRLNLATCYAKIGKLASAWALHRDSAALALRAGDAERRAYALEQAAALLPRLPRLTIAGPTTPPPGFVVTRDGLELDLATLGAAQYVDPGPHVVTASAPGFEPFEATITVGEAEAEAVVIRELAPSKTTAIAQLRSQPPQQRREGGAPPGGRSTAGRARKLVGLGVAGGGAILTGAGLVFGARARSTYSDVKAMCGAALICAGDTAFEDGQELVDRARTQATLSTVLVVTGVAAAAAGAVVWITAARRERAETAVLPIVTDRDLGVALMGRF